MELTVCLVAYVLRMGPIRVEGPEGVKVVPTFTGFHTYPIKH